MKIKSFFCMVMILSIIVDPITILKAETSFEDSMVNDNDKYEVYYSDPVELQYCLNLAADTIPDYVTGVYDIGDEEITFGLKNQRGYYYDHPNLAYRAIRGNGDEWFVFNEEYESAIKVKQYHKYNDGYYAPEFPQNVTFNNNISITFTDVNNVTFFNAYRYKDSFKTVKSEDIKNSPTKKVSNRILIHSAKNYEVYKFQVNEQATYTINTSSRIGSKTTILALVDHNFKYISDISSANPVITRLLDKGDYYILVRPTETANNLDCLLNISLGG